MAARSRPFSPMTTKPAAPILAQRPGPIELLAEALADALDQQAHRLARDLDEALHPQHVELFGNRRPDRVSRRGGIGCRRRYRRRNFRSRRDRAPLRRRGGRTRARDRPPPRRPVRAVLPGSIRPSRVSTILTARGTVARISAATRCIVLGASSGRPCSAPR